MRKEKLQKCTSFSLLFLFSSAERTRPIDTCWQASSIHVNIYNKHTKLLTHSKLTFLSCECLNKFFFMKASIFNLEHNRHKSITKIWHYVALHHSLWLLQERRTFLPSQQPQPASCQISRYCSPQPLNDGQNLCPLFRPNPFSPGIFQPSPFLCSQIPQCLLSSVLMVAY